MPNTSRQPSCFLLSVVRHIPWALLQYRQGLNNPEIALTKLSRGLQSSNLHHTLEHPKHSLFLKKSRQALSKSLDLAGTWLQQAACSQVWPTQTFVSSTCSYPDKMLSQSCNGLSAMRKSSLSRCISKNEKNCGLAMVSLCREGHICDGMLFISSCIHGFLELPVLVIEQLFQLTKRVHMTSASLIKCYSGAFM